MKFMAFELILVILAHFQAYRVILSIDSTSTNEFIGSWHKFFSMPLRLQNGLF